MSFKVTTFKKPKKVRKPAKPKPTPVEKFLEAIDNQLLLAKGEDVFHSVTKQPIKPWVTEIFGHAALVPKVGNSLLLDKNQGAAITEKDTPKKLLMELRTQVEAGKWDKAINKIAGSRKRKK